MPGRITFIRDWFVSPGVLTERMHLYLCEDLRPGPTELQPDEKLQARSSFLGRGDRDGPRRPDRRRASRLLALLICDQIRKR